MMESKIIVGLNVLGIVLAMFSIVYAVGIVWRVEKKLNISYKLFLAAVVVYAISLVLEIFNGLGSATMEIYIAITKIVFIALFLSGILMMRDLIRDMDGEK